MFFNLKKKVDNVTRKYELFLDSIDETAQIRIRGFDMSFNLLKEKLKKEGLELSEINCRGKNFVIKRTKKGYIPEKYVISSKECENDYKNGLKVYRKYKEDFERIHGYLLEKEAIMGGKYVSKKVDKNVLDEIVLSLGYGDVRRKILEENESSK